MYGQSFQRISAMHVTVQYKTGLGRYHGDSRYYSNRLQSRSLNLFVTVPQKHCCKTRVEAVWLCIAFGEGGSSRHQLVPCKSRHSDMQCVSETAVGNNNRRKRL